MGNPHWKSRLRRYVAHRTWHPSSLPGQLRSAWGVGCVARLHFSVLVHDKCAVAPLNRQVCYFHECERLSPMVCKLRGASPKSNGGDPSAKTPLKEGLGGA